MRPDTSPPQLVANASHHCEGEDPFSYANETSVSCSASTDCTSPPSDGDGKGNGGGSLDGCDSVASRAPRPSPRRSVRFSSVRVREYSVVEELAATSDDATTGRRRSLGWEYTEKGTCDLDVHLDKIRSDRKLHYLDLIQNHIHRAESQKQETESKKGMKKEKGFRSKVLKPLWKNTIEAANRFTVVMPAMYL